MPGKESRDRGRRFEKKVIQDLEDKGWTVCRFMKTVKLPDSYDRTKSWNGEAKLIDTQPKIRMQSFGNRTMPMLVNTWTGFPDFIAFKQAEFSKFEVIAVESKQDGHLTREEKDCLKWLAKSKKFSRILVASSERHQVKYTEFKWE